MFSFFRTLCANYTWFSPQHSEVVSKFMPIYKTTSSNHLIITHPFLKKNQHPLIIITPLWLPLQIIRFRGEDYENYIAKRKLFLAVMFAQKLKKHNINTHKMKLKMIRETKVLRIILSTAQENDIKSNLLIWGWKK